MSRESRLPTYTPRTNVFSPVGSVAATPSTSSALRSSTLGKRGANDAGLDNDSSAVRKQLSTYKLHISSLERDNHALKAKETENATKLEEQRLEIEKLKNERYSLYEGKMTEREKGEKREKEFYEERKQYADQVSHLRQHNSTISNELETLKSQHTILSGRHASLASKTQNEISLLTSRVQEVERERDELKQWERRAKGLSIELEEERRKALERRERGENEVQDKRVDETLQKEVKRQSLNLSAVWRENETLKSEVAELRSKKKDVDAVERVAKEVERALKDEIRVLQEQLERSRREMDSLTQEFPTPSTSDEITTLRSRLSTLSSLHTQAAADLVDRDLTIRDLRERISNLADSSRSSIAEITGRAQEAERELRWAREGRESAERREEVMRREVESLTAARRKGVSGTSAEDQGVRVTELESLVELYKSELEKVSRDSRDVEEKIAKGMGLVRSTDLDSAKEMISQLEKDALAFEATISELTTANTHLDGEVNDLMRRVASGEYNASNERCLELKANPAAKVMGVRQQLLDDLKADNAKLLERMKELEGMVGSGASRGSGDVQDGENGKVPRTSYDRLKKEKDDMEEAHAKRLLRLKEIFGSKSKEFLEAVFSLLGWRIKFDETGNIRMTSMYAPKGKSGLTIKFTSSEGHFGTMNMSGMMSRGLEEVRQFWVVERQSVPGFLAQVTTEMFEKTTIGRAAGYVGLEQ
ncbi:hypothetical protein IAT38_002002 [Cryptococcus sp. DSM 104549]